MGTILRQKQYSRFLNEGVLWLGNESLADEHLRWDHESDLQCQTWPTAKICGTVGP